MKKSIFLMALVVIVAACNSKGQETNEEVNVVEHYLSIKDALVATDATKAQKAAAAFIKVNQNKELDASLNAIANTTEVSVQRQAFESLSMNMYNFVKAGGADITLYKQYCPMAFNNKGAYWLAAETEVNNPYFGDRMLHCGSVQESISQ